MEKYGEFLFETNEASIKEALENITEEDVENCCGYKIFNRGVNYYHDGMVEEIHLNPLANTLGAEVQGSRNYDVEIFLEENEVYGTCSCEYYDTCKHIVAVLLEIVHESLDHLPVNTISDQRVVNSLDFLKDHLIGLDKEELVHLVMKFAPDNYILQIQNSQAGREDAMEIFRQSQQKLEKHLKDQELLWDPSGMEAAILNQLNNLKGLEQLLHEELRGSLLWLMESIEDAFCEGYLYVDNYYGVDDYFESVEINNFIISFVQKLEFTDKLKYIIELDDTLSGANHSTFEGLYKYFGACFSQDELGVLKEKILANISAVSNSLLDSLYQKFEPLLNYEEKELVLKKLTNYAEKYVVDLGKLLSSFSREEVAYNFLKKYIDNGKGWIGSETIILFLELSVKTGNNLKEDGLMAISANPKANILSELVKLGQKETKDFEKVLFEKKPEELLHFFEENKRFDDAIELIKANTRIYEKTVFDFFRKNKMNLKEEARDFFMNRIDANLEFTGEGYYAIIAETISQLKQIDKPLTDKVLDDIRSNYKRRTKLMGMLRRFS